MNLRLLKVILRNSFLEYFRDFTSSFFTFVFPLIFVIIFYINASSNPGAQQLLIGFESTLSLSETNAVLSTLEKVETVMIVPEGDDSLATIKMTRGSDGRPLITFYATSEFSAMMQTIAQAAAGADLAQPAFIYAFEATETGSDHRQLLASFFGLSLLQLGLFGTATPLLQQRAQGVFRHIRTLPVTISQIVAALLATRLVVAAVQMIGLYAISAGWLGFQIEGSILLFIAFLTVGTVCFVAMGFAIGGAVMNFQIGSMANLALNFLMLGLGNVFFTPAEDGMLSVISTVLPMTYLTDGLRSAATGQDQLYSPYIAMTVLAGFAILFTALAIQFFRFDMEHKK